MSCKKCDDEGRVFVTDGVTQGQDYGPEVQGHYERCDQCGGIRNNPAGKACKMYIEESKNLAYLMAVPDDFIPVVFGEYSEDDFAAYFAFFVPKGTSLKTGTAIEGFRYAEGTKETFGFTNYEVEAFRRGDSAYAFAVKVGSEETRFRIFPDGYGQSTFDGVPVEILSFYLPE